MAINTFHCFLLACVLLIAIYDVINGYEMIIQKAEIIKYDEKYVKNPTLQVMQYSRRRKPVLNFGAITMHLWDNNVTIDMIYEEFIKNEYKPSFVGLRFKLCDFIESPYFNIKKTYGYVCPLQPGEVRITNMTVNSEHFPNLFPYVKGRVIVSFNVKAVNVTMVTSHFYVLFKEK
ncbi:unnamed protein product [Colias eurytheme]|nr:unnamed protein product [Colias eurytheme]